MVKVRQNRLVITMLESANCEDSGQKRVRHSALFELEDIKKSKDKTTAR